VLTIAGMIASFYFLAQALKTIPVGTGYAIWTGIGAAGTAILGIILFSESAALPRLLCIGLIIGGIIGLKLTSS
jgi:quaternary ammonium compound-resistance protein SugE